MEPFTSNMALMDSLDSRRKSKDLEPEKLPPEIQQKLKQIEKAFK